MPAPSPKPIEEEEEFSFFPPVSAAVSATRHAVAALLLFVVASAGSTILDIFIDHAFFVHNPVGLAFLQHLFVAALLTSLRLCGIVRFSSSTAGEGLSADDAAAKASSSSSSSSCFVLLKANFKRWMPLSTLAVLSFFATMNSTTSMSLGALSILKTFSVVVVAAIEWNIFSSSSSSTCSTSLLSSRGGAGGVKLFNVVATCVFFGVFLVGSIFLTISATARVSSLSSSSPSAWRWWVSPQGMLWTLLAIFSNAGFALYAKLAMTHFFQNNNNNNNNSRAISDDIVVETQLEEQCYDDEQQKQQQENNNHPAAPIRTAATTLSILCDAVFYYSAFCALLLFLPSLSSLGDLHAALLVLPRPALYLVFGSLVVALLVALSIFWYFFAMMTMMSATTSPPHRHHHHHAALISPTFSPSTSATAFVVARLIIEAVAAPIFLLLIFFPSSSSSATAGSSEPSSVVVSNNNNNNDGGNAQQQQLLTDVIVSTVKHPAVVRLVGISCTFAAGALYLAVPLFLRIVVTSSWFIKNFVEPTAGRYYHPHHLASSSGGATSSAISSPSSLKQIPRVLLSVAAVGVFLLIALVVFFEEESSPALAAAPAASSVQQQAADASLSLRPSRASSLDGRAKKQKNILGDGDDNDASSSSSPSSNLLNGVILVLYGGPQDRIDYFFRLGLKSLDRFVLSCWPYPFLVFHEGIADTVKERIRAALPRGNAAYLRRGGGRQQKQQEQEQEQHIVKFDDVSSVWASAPHNLTKSQVKDWATQQHTSHSFGYRTMCRFWAGIVWQRASLDPYEYYWRLDTDSVITGRPRMDPFRLVFSPASGGGGAVYAYNQIVTDVPQVTTGLFDEFKKFLLDRVPLSVMSRAQKQKCMRIFSRSGDTNSYNLMMFYNNFELGTIALKRSDMYQSFFRWLDERPPFGIFRYRWGDAPIHTLGVHLAEHCDTSRMVRVSVRDVPYFHQDGDEPVIKWDDNC